MRRRALLASVGVSVLGGCASQGTPATTDRRTTDSTVDDEQSSTQVTSTRATTNGSDTDDARDGTDDPGDEPDHPEPPAGRRSASVIDLQTVNRTYAFSPTSRYTSDDGQLQFAFAAPATGERPAVLRAWLTNENPYENTFDVRDLPVVGRATSRNPRPFTRRFGGGTYRHELVVAPTPENALADGTPAVERDAGGLWRASRLDEWASETVTLDANERVFGEYYVVGHPDGGGLGRPTGVYEFRGAGDADFQIGVWRTDSPGPTESSRFDGRNVPSIGDGTTAWYHDATATSTSYLEPDSERGRLPEQVRFTMVNTSRSALQCGHWNLYKVDGGEWFHVAPYVHTADCRLLAPGRAKIYTLNAYHGEALGSIGSGRLGTSVGWLGAGTYAMVAGYAADADRSGALVELTGEARTVVPTADVTATRDGTTVRVERTRATEHDDESAEGETSATLVLERVADADRRLIAEQVMRDRFRGLRNTLAFAEEGVETVRLETRTDVARRSLGYDTDPTRFRFESSAFELALAGTSE